MLLMPYSYCFGITVPLHASGFLLAAPTAPWKRALSDWEHAQRIWSRLKLTSLEAALINDRGGQVNQYSVSFPSVRQLWALSQWSLVG